MSPAQPSVPPGRDGDPPPEAAAEAPAPDLALPWTALPGAGIVQAVRQIGERELVLDTYQAGSGARHWLISAQGGQGRLIETFSPGHAGRAGAKRAARPAALFPATVAPAGLVQWLRPRLLGGQVLGWRSWQPLVAVLGVATREGTLQIVAEWDRSAGNLLALDEAGRVLAAWLPPALPGRPLAVGAPYRLPRNLRLAQRGKGEFSRWPVADRDAARALDQQWQERGQARELELRREQVLRQARVALKRLQRRVERIQSDLAAAEQADSWREWGELLKIHAHAVPAGASEVSLPNEFQPGRPAATIPLEPGRSVADNIARLFHRYRRLRDGLPHIRRRLDQTRSELATWAALEQALALAGAPDQVRDALAGLPTDLGAAPAAARDERQTASRKMPSRKSLSRETSARGTSSQGGLRRRVSADGMAILVGRSSADNDRLTFRLGHGRDWWLHALGVAGSHVLVRNPGGGELPPRTLRQAAWLAAYYSKGRARGELEVTLTQVKHVRKPRGAKPGEVSAARGRTLWVKLDDPELRKILDAPEAPEV